jgi:hypothetical protein
MIAVWNASPAGEAEKLLEIKERWRVDFCLLEERLPSTWDGF